MFLPVLISIGLYIKQIIVKSKVQKYKSISVNTAMISLSMKLR